ALVFAGLFARAGYIQVVEANHFAQIAHSQHQQVQTVAAGRGTIFDRTGVELAIGEQMSTVYADPQEVTDPSGLAIAAHHLLGVNPNALYPALLDKKSQFAYVKRFADPAKAAELLKRGF